ncbi:MAG TPA: hypothetical protein DIT04_10940 [Dysgonomonas sp.]|nr:hypothetical protein [Dysgonomonas sp.]
MHQPFIILSALNLSLFIMHEFDAFRKGEWRMFAFLKPLGEKFQYNLFLWLHLPLLLFVFYYFGTVIDGGHTTLWMVWNSLMILHLIVHLTALKWKSNVFDAFSFIWIGGTGLTSLINIILILI